MDDAIVEGNGGFPLFGEGGTTGNNYSIRTLQLNTATQIKGGISLRKLGGLTIGTSGDASGATVYDEVKRWAKVFRLKPNMSDVNLGLPSGLYRRLRIFVSSTAGITNFYIQNTSGQGNEIKASLSSGNLVDLTINFGNYGTDYPFASVDTKATHVYTDGTVPDGAWGVMEIEYFASPAGDGSNGFVQDDSRVVRATDLMLTTGQMLLGTSADTNLYRSGADQLKSDDKFIATLGIGVGNSALATTPGTVVRKIEVFDASGSSLGFVPVYNTIT
jgi:hypothetical protein